MKPKNIWANFSVQDAQRTHRFYSRLGFAHQHSNDPRLVSFLFGEDGFVIHFFEQGSQIDAYLPPRTNPDPEIIFTLSAATTAEVQAWLEHVRAAGGTVLQDAGRDETHHYGFAFADPDGHRFNVLLMEAGM